MKPRPTWSIRVSGYCVALCVVLIALAPCAYMIALSLVKDGALSLAAYHNVLSGSRQWRLMYTSVSIALGSAFFATLLGVPAGFALERGRLPMKGLFLFALAVPFLIPPYVSTTAWVDLTTPRGLLAAFQKTLFGGVAYLPNVKGVAGAIFVLSLAYFPVPMLATIVGLRRYNRHWDEAAWLVGNGRGAFVSVLLPIVTPSIATGSLFVYILSLINLNEPSLLQVNTYPVEIFTEFNSTYSPGEGTAQAMPLFAAGLGAFAVWLVYVRPRRGWLRSV